jgi:integrase/recombinase XerD
VSRVGPAVVLHWCVERELKPLTLGRVQVELYVRWMQEVRRFKLSRVSRRMAVVTGFYRTCGYLAAS